LSNQIEQNEVGGECNTYEGEQRHIQGTWWGILRESDTLEDKGLERRIILRWIFRKWDMENGLDQFGAG
jgi:hypothetical protein